MQKDYKRIKTQLAEGCEVAAYTWFDNFAKREPCPITGPDILHFEAMVKGGQINVHATSQELRAIAKVMNEMADYHDTVITPQVVAFLTPEKKAA